jgi:hypothetical protein
MNQISLEWPVGAPRGRSLADEWDVGRVSCRRVVCDDSTWESVDVVRQAESLEDVDGESLPRWSARER